MTTARRKVPSLEWLVNQCCEDYYKQLNESFDLQQGGGSGLDVQKQGYFTYDQFEQYIKSSHCMENLKFLIQIYHYEKIWNKIFKRQSSILKCKDESWQQQRKHSVATIFTNNSSFKRHMSIAEVPEPDDKERIDSIHSLDNSDINKLVSELTIPHFVRSVDDIDAKSIVSEPLSIPRAKDSHSPTISLTPPSPPPQNSQENPHTHSHAHAQAHEQPMWNTLFKPAYCETAVEYDCLCKVERDPRLMNSARGPRNSFTPTDEFDNKLEYNDGLKQLELREQLKAELETKFHEIVSTYVSRDSPFEINLPNEVYNDLIREYENEKILYHSPSVLLPAKNVVLQLLRENIYYKFLSQQEELLSREESLKSIDNEAISLALDSQPSSTENLQVLPVVNGSKADVQSTHSRSTSNGGSHLVKILSHFKMNPTAATTASIKSPHSEVSSIRDYSNGVQSDVELASYVSGDSSFVLKTPSLTGTSRDGHHKHGWRNRLMSFRKNKRDQ